MFRYAAIYGAIAGTVVILVMGLFISFAGDDDFSVSETMGYLVMLVILSLIFIGIKRFRDVECGGVIGFGRAFGLGAAIAAIAGVFYVISWEAYLALTDYAFIDNYGQSLIAAAQDLPAAERAARVAEIESSMAMYRNPLFRFGITFIEILPVGLVVALVSALLLKNPRILPARRAA